MRSRIALLAALLFPLAAAAHPGHEGSVAAAGVVHFLLEHALPLCAVAVVVAYAGYRRMRAARQRTG